MAPCATTFRWWPAGPAPESEGETAAARISSAPRCRGRPPRVSGPPPRLSARGPRTTDARQWAAGRLVRISLVRGQGRAARILLLAGRRPREWPAAPRTRGPWGASSPTRSRYSRDHERKGQPRPASPAHAQHSTGKPGQDDRAVRAHRRGAAKDPSAPPPAAAMRLPAAALPCLAVPPLPISLIPPNKLIRLLCLLVRYPHASPLDLD